ncbi:TetR/AcrR family transcriptional regulator [Kibdelosporangium phytohabitans]|uniref:HTH tetR-type domain-containing protein n=1 Tax=Kibdelosporangium phytohabitans TaxID=860235 RepID=A0A0N9I1Y7_9PSEU|nr:TetR family transcriptional regulator C-terminal domain-containing protein [Kibdelosporangium phytohabitans]ALG09866.1 hypothetical protein AOZ06_25860 [Kibdelosporangium phytohabitans]MBE1468738.1 AcrR family transcriptional regulator [Kibdelosporangium phytohabitans]
MPKVVDHDTRRAELIAATWRTIRRLGLPGTTTREIAREAGVSHGQLAYYFDDKDAIVEAALQRAYELARSQLAERVAGRTGIDAVRECLVAALPLGDARLETEVLVSSWGDVVSDETRRASRYASFSEWRDHVRLLVRIAATLGEITPDVPAENIADALVAVVDGLTLHAVLSPRDYPPRRLLDTLDLTLDRYRVPRS